MRPTGAILLGQAHAWPEEFARRLHHGDPVVGWKGDPDLALFWNKPRDCWELWHHQPAPGHPDRHALVIQGAPGQGLDIGEFQMILKGLAEADTTRAGNSWLEQALRDQAHNDKLEAQKLEDSTDELMDPMDRVFHAAANDLGVPKTFFGGYGKKEEAGGDDAGEDT